MRGSFGKLPIGSQYQNFLSNCQNLTSSPLDVGEKQGVEVLSLIGGWLGAPDFSARPAPLLRRPATKHRRPCPLPGRVLCESFLMLRLGERGPCSSVAGSLPDDDSKSIRGSRGRSSISAAACSSNRPWRIGDRMLGREQSREPLGMRRSG